MLLLEVVCPQCGSPLGAFDIRKGLPCEKCGIFFQTAWKLFEDGKRRQYLKQVDDYKRDAESDA